MQSEIEAQFPKIDPVVVEYASGYLNHASQQFSSESDPLEEAAAAITQLLLSASGDLSGENEVTVQNLVDKFVSRLQSQNAVDGERRQQAPSAKKLDQTIHVGSSRMENKAGKCRLCLFTDLRGTVAFWSRLTSGCRCFLADVSAWMGEDGGTCVGTKVYTCILNVHVYVNIYFNLMMGIW